MSNISGIDVNGEESAEATESPKGRARDAEPAEGPAEGLVDAEGLANAEGLVDDSGHVGSAEDVKRLVDPAGCADKADDVPED